MKTRAQVIAEMKNVAEANGFCLKTIWGDNHFRLEDMQEKVIVPPAAGSSDWDGWHKVGG